METSRWREVRIGDGAERGRSIGVSSDRAGDGIANANVSSVAKPIGRVDRRRSMVDRPLACATVIRLAENSDGTRQPRALV